MDKETAFLIYLYDKQLEEEADGNNYEAILVAEIREKYADMFNINDRIREFNEQT